MLQYRETMSAFAMYAMKRKNAELSSNSKKLKKKHSSPETRAALRNDTKDEIQGRTRQSSTMKTVGEMKKIPVNEGQGVNQKSKLISKKTNSSTTAKKSKSIQKPIHKAKDKKVTLICDSKGLEPKTKLKSSILTLNTGVAKMKQIKQNRRKPNKKKVVLKMADEKSTCANSKMVEENHENPLNTSRSMFEWLIHPMKAEDFFE